MILARRTWCSKNWLEWLQICRLLCVDAAGIDTAQQTKLNGTQIAGVWIQPTKNRVSGDKTLADPPRPPLGGVCGLSKIPRKLHMEFRLSMVGHQLDNQRCPNWIGRTSESVQPKVSSLFINTYSFNWTISLSL
jgi:hypothetical protein